MPRKSPFVITLSDEETKILKRHARQYTLPHFEVVRAQMILLASEGLQNDQIAARLNTRREVVSQWRKRFFYERLPGLDERARPGRPRAFPPEVIVQVKALACELPATRGLPLSRISIADVAREVRSAGIVARISDKTVWRWPDEDAIRPWQHRCWIFPRDPDFWIKAGRILDLYERHWNGAPLRDDEFVISTDEKTRIQARRSTHTPLPTAPRQAMRHRTRICASRRMGVPGRVGRPPGENLWARRARHRDRPVRPAHGRCHDAGALSLGSPRLLDHGQWFFASWPGLHRSHHQAMAERCPGPHAGTRQLAQASRDLLLDPPAQSPDTQ